MPRKPSALALLIVLLVSGGVAWPMGQKMDIFVPVDALIEEKPPRYAEAIDTLRGLLVSAPSRTSAIKERIAKTQLDQADYEIAQQSYNEALATLSLFWAQNPERADQAQKLIRKINKVREDYNRLAKALLAYMRDAANRSDPTTYNEEVDRKLQELDKLDRNNPDSKKTITSLKETSTALVYQDRMKRVMSEGRTLIDRGEFVKAAQNYLKEFTLFKAEFEDSSSYDDLTKQVVAGEARKAAAVPNAFEAMRAGVAKAVADLAAAFASGSPEAISAALPAAEASLEELRALREALFASGKKIALTFDAIPKEGRSPIEYQYLAFLDIFIRGRSDSLGEDKKTEAEKGKPEAIGGALLAQTDSLLDGLGKAAQARVDAAYAQAEKSYDEGSYAEAETAFARASAVIAPAAKVLANWALVPEGDFVPDLSAIKAKIAAAAADQSRVEQLGALSAAGERLSGLARGAVAAGADSAAYLAGLGLARPLGEVRSTLDGYRASLRAIEASLKAEAEGRAGLGATSAAAAAAFAAYSERLDKAAAAAQAGEYALVSARFGVEGDYVERELASRTAALAAAEFLIDGQASTRPERAGYKDPSPTSATLALNAEAPKQAALSSWLSEDLGAMKAESPALAAEAPFAAARARIEGLAQRAAELQARRAVSLARASDQKKAAEAALVGARQDLASAKARLTEAKALIVQDKAKGAKSAAIKKDFADSRGRLDRSLEGVIESSRLDFDARAWDEFKALYSQASADLGQTKKDYTINETFRLLGEGQGYYEQALFDLAAESLNGAQELWREDNLSDQEQVKYWQNLVRQASDTNNKREVRPSDALYYEIGSYLSEARKIYLKGDALIKSGRKTDAMAAFAAAEQNLAYVTRAFPLNAEAGLLKLQISKSTDPETYKISLPRRIQEARALLSTDAASGYSRLADLYRMEPTYKGLKSWLEEAEIAVGKRRAPPTKQALAQAASLVAEAEKLLKTGRAADSAKAEEDLNSALKSDPANKRALALLRDLTTIQGKTSGPTLALTDQSTLDQATRSFASRQYNQARDQLNQLLSDPGKRTKEVLKLDNDLKTLGYN